MYSPTKPFHGYSHIAGENDKSNRSRTVNSECRNGADDSNGLSTGVLAPTNRTKW